MHPIPEILDALRRGEMIVLVDDETRENEGDLVCAAQHVSPQTVNFMLREGRGMMCVALGGELCDRLDLPPQSAVNTSQRSTAYTITVDAAARFGLTTGVSAADRAVTARQLASPEARPTDFDRPGHMQPLRARDGGCLVRAGQTEGSVDLCRLAGLRPAAVIIEVMNADGSMARRDDLHRLCEQHQLKMCSVADVIQHRLAREKLVERIDTAPFRCEAGEFTLIAYRSLVDSLPHVALTCGNVGKLDESGEPVVIDEPVLVRMHSQNLLGDVFGDVDDPSGKLLQAAMRRIQQEGRGAVVYLRHEGMGKGLLQRLQTLHHPRDAEPAPAMNASYGIGSQILRDLGLRQLRLLTNHPVHPTALSGFGLEITAFEPITESTADR